MENFFKNIWIFTLGFLIGFIIMNIPSVMKNSATYRSLTKEQRIERRTKI